MKKVISAFILSAACINASAQSDSTAFKGYFSNSKYGVYIQMNLYDSDVSVPNHTLFGELPGYLGKRMNNFYWLITSGKVKSAGKAELSLINDYGSEDLTATFIKKNDSTYVLRQEDGSTLKVPDKGKWQKLPKELEFKKKK